MNSTRRLHLLVMALWTIVCLSILIHRSNSGCLCLSVASSFKSPCKSTLFPQNLTRIWRLKFWGTTQKSFSECEKQKWLFPLAYSMHAKGQVSNATPINSDAIGSISPSNFESWREWRGLSFCVNMLSLWLLIQFTRPKFTLKVQNAGETKWKGPTHKHIFEWLIESKVQYVLVVDSGI